MDTMNDGFEEEKEEEEELVEGMEIIESIECTTQPLEFDECQIKIEAVDEYFEGEVEESLDINEYNTSESEAEQNMVSIEKRALPCVVISKEAFKEVFESEQEFFKRLVKSKYPLVLTKKLSRRVLKKYMINVEDLKKNSSRNDLKSFGGNMQKLKDIKKPTSKTLPNSLKSNVQKLRDIKKYPHKKNLTNIIEAKYSENHSLEMNFTNSREKKEKSEKNANDDTKVAKNLSVKLRCPLCNSRFESKDDLKEHIPIHTGDVLLRCSECKYVTHKESCLKHHKLKHTKTKYVCPECGYECYPKSRLKDHMLLHSSVKSFKCSYCPYEANHEKKLAIHMVRHTSSQVFKCSECDYETYYKEILKSHMLKHNSQKLFKCSECSYECNFKNCLKLHMAKHTGEKKQKPLKCFACSFECLEKSTLKTHKLIHKKIYKCSECDFMTIYRKNLVMHFYTHTDKPFKCSECNYKCSDTDFLKQHMLSHIILYDPTNKQWMTVI